MGKRRKIFAVLGAILFGGLYLAHYLDIARKVLEAPSTAQILWEALRRMFTEATPSALAIAALGTACLLVATFEWWWPLAREVWAWFAELETGTPPPQAANPQGPTGDPVATATPDYVSLQEAARRLYSVARKHGNAGLAETMMDGDPDRITQWYCRTIWRNCTLYGKHPPSPEREIVPRDLESFYAFRLKDGVLTLGKQFGKGGSYFDLEVLESELPSAFAEVEGAEGGSAWQHSSTRAIPVSEAPQPISLVDLAALADAKFGWDLLSGSSRSGWQLWDLKSGLAHAANQGHVTFEGKRFAGFANPPPNSPFLQRDELYAEIKRDEWQLRRLEICVPGMHFGAVSSNFEVTICSTLDDNSTRYWDVRLTDRAAAERWLERETAIIRGKSEEIHNQEQERKTRLFQELIAQNAQEPDRKT